MMPLMVTLFTLFVVPAVYVLLAKDRKPQVQDVQQVAAETTA
jgi:hypothetical protein